MIERPASVVKELVENAIDAGSTDIGIEIINAGKTRIVVGDNGIGMTPQEAELCLQRHATSKISVLEDLFDVKTLGFRGEALPSIASVSKLKLTTRHQDAVEAVSLVFEGEKKIEARMTGAPRGTELSVANLFYNTPARLKFLKSDATELSRCSEVVSQLAMANPRISFRLTHQGRKICHYVSSKSLLERVLSVLNEKRESFLPIEETLNGWRLEGFAGVASLIHSTPRWYFTYVNGRPVKDRTLHHAISAAYRGVIPHGMYPKVILFLETPSHEIDVNVHPTKQEIRFRNAHVVHRFVEQSIKRGLERQARTVGFVKTSLDAFKAGVQESVLAHQRYKYFPKGVEILPQSEPSINDRVGNDLSGNGPRRICDNPFSSLRYIGQLKSSYLICEDDDALVFIDQHAAHERVLFEGLKEQHEKTEIQSQYVWVPLSLELTDDEGIVMKESFALFKNLGFEIEHFGGKTFVVKALPRILLREKEAEKVSLETIRSLLLELKELPKIGAAEELMHRHISTLACHTARTAKEKLEPTEVYELLKALDHLKAAPHCPHGRPFSFSIALKDIEKKFHR